MWSRVEMLNSVMTLEGQFEDRALRTCLCSGCGAPKDYPNLVE